MKKIIFGVGYCMALYTVFSAEGEAARPASRGKITAAQPNCPEENDVINALKDQNNRNIINRGNSWKKNNIRYYKGGAITITYDKGPFPWSYLISVTPDGSTFEKSFDTNLAGGVSYDDTYCILAWGGYGNGGGIQLTYKGMAKPHK